MKPRTYSSEVPIAFATTVLSEATSLEEGSVSACIEKEAETTEVYIVVGEKVGRIVGIDVGDGDGNLVGLSEETVGI